VAICSTGRFERRPVKHQDGPKYRGLSPARELMGEVPDVLDNVVCVLCCADDPLTPTTGHRAGLLPDHLREVDGWTDWGVGPVNDVLQYRRGKPGCLF
jgi:hypothetical protein